MGKHRRLTDEDLVSETASGRLNQAKATKTIIMKTIINEFKNSQSVSDKIGFALSGVLFGLFCVTLPVLVVNLIMHGVPSSFGLLG